MKRLVFRVRFSLIATVAIAICLQMSEQAEAQYQRVRATSAYGQWPYHVEPRLYHHYQVIKGQESGYRDRDGNIWTPYGRDGTFTGSPKVGQVEWHDGDPHHYQLVWRVHYPEITKKKIWICETDLGTWCITHLQPSEEASAKWFAAVASLEDGFSIKGIEWAGEKPEWADKHLGSIVRPDMRPMLPNWAYTQEVKWTSTGRDLRLKREANANAVQQRKHDFYGDTGDGNVTRYTRQAGSPKDGYLADDGSRWKDYVPNGTARYGNLRSQGTQSHRYSYMWSIRGVGRPETVDVWVYPGADGHHPSLSFHPPSSSTKTKSYHARIVKVGGFYRSVTFTGGEPWNGASQQIIRLYGG